MRPIARGLAAALLAATFAGPAAAGTDTTTALASGVATKGARSADGGVVADLIARGYDLGRFKPDHDGRYPYR